MSNRSLAVTAAVALLLGGVAAQAAVVPSSAAQSVCGGATRGLKTVSVQKAGFRMGVPRSWKTFSGAAFGRALEGDPSMAQYGAMLKDPRSPLKLFAFACEPRRAYPSTLTVIALAKKSGSDWKFSEFVRGAVQAIRGRAVSGHAPKVERFRVGIGQAVRIRAVIHAAGVPTPVSSTTYLVQTRKTAYIISYATAPGLAQRYAHLFDDSVRSLREL
jgi:hypothetical protein